MKMTFFLIAIFLILLRIVNPRLALWHNNHEQGTMITKGPDYIQGIWWAGKIRLSDDERSIAEISPGGHLKFREQDTIMNAESDLQGEITYTLQNGREDLPLNDSGQRFIARQIQKMIRLGFFAEGRAERIYNKGGAEGLLAELSNIRMEGARDPYLKLLFQADTLTVIERLKLLQLLDSSNNMMQQQHYLGLMPLEQLRDTAIAHAWLKSVGRLEPAHMKKDLLLHFIDSGLPTDQFDTVLEITEHFRSEPDQQAVYKRLLDLPQLRMRDSAFAQPWLCAVGQLNPSYMKKDLLLLYLNTPTKLQESLPADQFDTVLAVSGRFGSPEDQKEVYNRLIDMPFATNAEWIGLIRVAGALQPDYLKSELLLKIAPKMPRTDSLISAYRSSAKRIQADMDYGKVLRAIE